MFETTRDSKRKAANAGLSPQILLQRLADGGIVELDRWWISVDNYGSQVLCRHPHGIDVALRGLSLSTCEFVLKMIAGEHSPRSWSDDLSKKSDEGSEGCRQSPQARGFAPALCQVQ